MAMGFQGLYSNSTSQLIKEEFTKECSQVNMGTLHHVSVHLNRNGVFRQVSEYRVFEMPQLSVSNANGETIVM